MTEFLARFSARKPFLIIAIWAVIGLVAGGFAVDAEIAPWPPPLTDFLDRATTTEFKLSSSAGSERADRLLEDRLRGAQTCNRTNNLSVGLDHRRRPLIPAQSPRGGHRHSGSRDRYRSPPSRLRSHHPSPHFRRPQHHVLRCDNDRLLRRRRGQRS